MAPEYSQQLRVQDSAPIRRCGTEGRTGHQDSEGGNGDGNRNGSGDRREDEYGDGHEGRDGGEDESRNWSRSGNLSRSGSGRKNEDDNRVEGGGESEPGNLRSGNRGGSKDAKRWATPTNNQQPQPQDLTPRRIMLRTRAQRRAVKDRIGEGGGEAKTRKKLYKN